jgi:hypothetical protein
MKKRVRINNDKVKKLVSEKLKKDGTFVHESKIDRAIIEYLRERKENLDIENTPEQQNVFSEKAKEAFDDMASALYDIVEDLMVIQTKEGDVMADDYPEMSADEYINQLVNQIELVIEAVEHLRDFEPEEQEDSEI